MDIKSGKFRLQDYPSEGSIIIKKPVGNIMDFRVEFEPFYYLDYEFAYKRIDFEFRRCIAIFSDDFSDKSHKIFANYIQLDIFAWEEVKPTNKFFKQTDEIQGYKFFRFRNPSVSLYFICKEYKITPVYFSKIGKQLNYLREKMRNYLAIKRSKEDEKPKIPQFNPKFYGNEEQ